MRPVCVLCGRPTHPYAMLGMAAVGPKCAARAGITPARLPPGARVTFVRPAARVARPVTVDLFEALP